VAFLVERGYLRLTTEYSEAWQPWRETWTEAQKNQDDRDVIEFRHDVARIYDRAIKRAMQAVGNGAGGIGRLKVNLESYRHENLPPAAQGAAVDLTIGLLDGLMREREGQEALKRLAAEKAMLQGTVRELADRAFLTVTHDFQVAYVGWRAKEKAADEASGASSEASEAAAAKKALQAAALTCYKVAVFVAANSPDPTIRERFRPYNKRRLTLPEMSWVTSEVRDVLQRQLFQRKTERAVPQPWDNGPRPAKEARGEDTFPDLAASEISSSATGIIPSARHRRGAIMTGALLFAEIVGVAIGGTVGFFVGQSVDAERAAARMSAYHSEAQKAVDDEKRKVKRLAEMNLQAVEENKALRQELRKLRAAVPPDLAAENARLGQINSDLRKEGQDLAERVKARDHALDELRNERERRQFPKKGGLDRKK
jgi:hypothetical protein